MKKEHSGPGSSVQGPEEKNIPELREEIEILKIALEQKTREAEDHRNMLMRSMADFDNYKKRTAAEKEQLVCFGNEELITKLLPVVDGFEMAMEAAEKHSQNTEDIIKGLLLVKKQMEDALRKFGVEKIETLGRPFDAHVAEAISKQESDEPENTVIQEMHGAYKLNGRLIRPAMVIISKGKEKSS